MHGCNMSRPARLSGGQQVATGCCRHLLDQDPDCAARQRQRQQRQLPPMQCRAAGMQPQGSACQHVREGTGLAPVASKARAEPDDAPVS